MQTITALKNIAKEIRIETVKMAHRAPSSHVACALSCVDILVALFFEEMTMDDRFIMSKGHGCMSYYAVLARAGFFPEDWLLRYSQNGSSLAEHPLAHGVPGVEFGTGSLGHGLGLSVGEALAKKLKSKVGYEFVLLGDGECNEGSVWESAMVASNLELDNLIAIVDHNRMQAAGFIDKDSMYEKWKSFGWQVFIISGNSMLSLVSYLRRAKNTRDKPAVIIANTTKGSGVSFMEDDLLWHYRSPNDEELRLALEELRDA